MASPAAGQIAGAPALPVELLEEIFLLLDAPADLARASAACPAFHRVVTGRRFLRRYRSLHPPPVLGFLDPNQPVTFIPADPPHRNAPAARALAQAADFTFAFLPAPNTWRVCDALDARVLLRRGVRPYRAAFDDDRVVCDPLHRRYVQLPPIPDDLAVSTGVRGRPILNFNCFLDPAIKDDDVSFGVIGAVQLLHKLVTFHFSSVTGKWHALTFDRELPLHNDYEQGYVMFEQHYAHGHFFWTIAGGLITVMQDTPKMRLCKFEIPAATYCQPKAIFEVGQGRLGLLALRDDGVFDLYCKTLGDNCVGTQEWRHDRTIPLPKLDSTKFWWILGAFKGYLLLTVCRQFSRGNSRQQIPPTQYFTLDLNTFLIERLSLSIQRTRGYLYASFPPPLSLPSI